MSPWILTIVLFVVLVLAGYLVIKLIASGKFSSIKKENLSRLTIDKSNIVNEDYSSKSFEHGRFDEYLIKLDIFKNLKSILIRADIDRSVGEILGFSVGIFMIIFGASFILLRAPILASTILGLLCASSIIIYVLYKEANIRLNFEKQLPEALDFLSRALRAGHGIASAIKMVGDEMPNPIGKEFSIVSDELNFGIPFTQVLTNLGLRVNSKDLNFFIVALAIQRETGGNLTEILTIISKTMRERVKLSGKIRTLSAEGKTSGIILGSMPFFMALILNTLNPGYFEPLLAEGGNILLLGFVLLIFGGLWIMKIVRIKV